MQVFAKKGQTVLVKPNIGWDTVLECAATTNPKLIAKIVEHCLKAGAKKVFVFDKTCGNWQKCYSSSDIEKAVKDAGGKVISGNSKGMDKPVSILSGKSSKSAMVQELILNRDVFINKN